MPQKITLLHYASAPGIGGVETMISHQARGLADLGYTVQVVSGQGEPFDPRIETIIHPLLGSSHPEILEAKKCLDQGIVPPAFEKLVSRIMEILQPAMVGCDICIAHNLLSMNKNLAFTAALTRLHALEKFRLIAWCSDLAWANPQYLAELHAAYPWNLLCQPWLNARYMTISPTRRIELAQLFNVPLGNIAVITPGIDPATFFRWTPLTARLVEQLGLLDADGLLLLPARLTRRKNIAFALHVLEALRRQSNLDFRLVVTGPPGPHNPTNPGYLGELLELRQMLNLETSAHFLYTDGASADQPLNLDDDTLADLYRLADGLFFPSTQEGFGIPILEAGLSGLPIFCADIPPLRETAGEDATYFHPTQDDPEQVASQILKTLKSDATYRLRNRVRHRFRWETILRAELIPLLEEA